MKAIISNGSFRFHLSALAAEMDRRGILKLFFTGGYPTNFIRLLARFKKNSPSINRLLDRGSDNIDIKKVSADNFSEIFIRLGVSIFSKISIKAEQSVVNIGYSLYSYICAIKLLFIKADIYHYRNCYGGLSVRVARWRKMKTICDHSIAHPFLIDYMTVHKGQYPSSDSFAKLKNDLLPLYKKMYQDLGHDDTILVNSDFVKNTMVYCGMPENKIKVIYLGVDDAFLNILPQFNKNEGNINTILFAGGLQYRKGIIELLSTISKYEQLHVDLAGGIDLDVANDENFKKVIVKDNIKYHGILTRKELALLMSSHKIFIFTSYCEGSARVIFEALAAGLFVITTENSGSVVKNMENGLIVRPGNAIDLENAINWVLDANNECIINQIRQHNYNLVRSFYRQRDYGNKVFNLYSELNRY
ncbi:MAG: glycosyltransferase family 4 protein [Flavobacterium sp.]|nr:glycosyltransferase family 4 protein [Flavobacterium sp.]